MFKVAMKILAKKNRLLGKAISVERSENEFGFLLLSYLLCFDMRREFAGAEFDKPTDEARNTLFVDPCCCFSLGNPRETACQQPFRISYFSRKSAELSMRGYASTWL